MKTKYVYVTTAILCIFLILVVFKLNDYYKSEKIQITQNQMSQQNSSLKTSISTQLGQLKNILSSYAYHIDENKLNWMQIDPLMTLAQTHISQAGNIEVKNIFSKSGSKTERWNKDFLQKALERKKYSHKNIQADLFQTKSGDKYVALTFLESDPLAPSGFEAVTVIGDANYFQKFFDLNRSQKVTHVLLTDLNLVAGHNEADYIATVSSEAELNINKYFIDSEDLRSSNLKIISYAAKGAVLSFLNIPMMLFGLILGFSCLLVGILFYAFRPIEKIIQDQKKAVREELFQKTLQKNLEVNLEKKIEANLEANLKETTRKTNQEHHAKNQQQTQEQNQEHRAAAIPDLDAIFGAMAQKPSMPPQDIHHNDLKEADMKLATPHRMDHQAVPEDLDLDQILNLDQLDQDDVFKIDPNTPFVESPEIQLQKNEKPLDQFKVRIRGPQKS